MATLKSILKRYFFAGEKPKEEHFHEWMDSYVHKTEDGLAISENGNLGVGTEEPQARLHVEGGLVIGNVPDDQTQVVLGTLRWTGTELQIFFPDTWTPIWPLTQVQGPTPDPDPNEEPDPEYVNKAISLDFDDLILSETGILIRKPGDQMPTDAKQLVAVSFTVKGMQKYSRNLPRDPNSGSTTNVTRKDKIAIRIRGDNNAIIWSGTIVQNTTSEDPTRIAVKQGVVSGTFSVEDLNSFSFEFEAVSDNFTRATIINAGNNKPILLDPIPNSILDPVVAITKIDLTFLVPKAISAS